MPTLDRLLDQLGAFVRLARLGVRDVGENRVREAAAKVSDLAAADAEDVARSESKARAV